MEPAGIIVNDVVIPWREGSSEVGQLQLSVSSQSAGSGEQLTVSLRNTGTETVRLREVAVGFTASPQEVLEHGWQSWSVVRRCSPSDVRPQRQDSPEWVRAMALADPTGAGQVVSGDQFLLTDEGVAGFIGGRSHFSVIKADHSGLRATALLDDVELGAGCERALEPLWWAQGDPGKLYTEFLERWGDHDHARAGTPAPLGWCSWYQYYDRVTPGDIRAQLDHLVDHGIGVVQIDDGYQSAVGHWLDQRPGWEGAPSELASEAAAKGLSAGLWTAPFLVAEVADLARKRPEWLVADESGTPLRVMHNPGSWGGWAHALDTTHPGVLEHLGQTFRGLVEIGFDYHKVDFCYSAAVPGWRYRQDLTRAEALSLGLDTIRDSIGDQSFLLGCGCPFGPAVGVVDAMRVSPDVAPFWSPRAAYAGFEEHPPSALNAIQATVLRAPMHRRLWINDPDCLILRSFDTELSEHQRAILAAVVGGAGGFVVLSDDLSRYGSSEWDALDKVTGCLPDADSPLELVDPFAPAPLVRSRTLELLIDWDPTSDATVPDATVPDATVPMDMNENVVIDAIPKEPGPWALLRRRST